MRDEDTKAGESATRDADQHLADVADGCGCVEVWEHLSDERDDADD